MPEDEKNQQTSGQPSAGWQFHGDGQTNANPETAAANQKSEPIEAVEWSASEFVEHSKSSSWYLLVAVGGALLATAVYLLTKDKVSSAMIVIVVVIFAVFAARRPRVLGYSVDDTGIRIGEKFYPYTNFKSFATVQEGAIDSVWLMPLKRFMPILTIYFEQKDESKIVAVLGQFLPVESHQLDAVDRLMHKLRF